MSTKISWKDTLYNAAKSRRLKLSRDDIDNLAGEIDSSSLEGWIDRNLSSNTLLTTDELTLWHHISRDRLRAPQSEAQFNTVVTPLDEAGLSDAIAALEASTAHIETQANCLKQQRAILDKYRERHDGLSDGHIYDQGLERKQQAESQHLKFINRELLSKLTLDLDTTQEKIEKSTKALSTTITECLRSDDRDLNNLERTLEDFTGDDESKISALQDHINKLLTALRHATVATIKENLDKVYLRELQACEDIVADEDQESQEQYLQSDLESLYTEIEDVTTMLVQHEHGSQLELIMQEMRMRREAERSQTMNIVHTRLEFMTEHLQSLVVCLRNLQSHEVVVQAVRAEIEYMSKESLFKVSEDTSQISKRPRPALTALLQRLNVKPDVDNKETNLDSEIAAQKRRLQENIDHAIRDLDTTTRRTLESRQGGLDLLSNTHDHDSSTQKETIETLEENIGRLKAEIEAVSL